LKENLRSIGTTYEQLGADYLENEGYKFVSRNLFTPFGEVDLILEKDDRLFFVEVKFRSNQNYGSARESITTLKLKRLKKSVAYLMKGKFSEYTSFSISFLGIEMQDEALQFDFIDNIFS
jgi:putative endonuclease